MEEDQTYKNGGVYALSSFWNPLLSSSSPSRSLTLVPATPYPRATLAAIFSAPMEPEFTAQHRSLTNGPIQDPSITTVQGDENGSVIIKDERTYDDRNLVRRHTVSNPAFAAHGTTSNHSSLYNSHSPQYQFQPRYENVGNALLPASQLPDMRHRLHPIVNHQPNQNVLNNHVTVSESPNTTHEIWSNGSRVSMGSLFTSSTTPVVPWNPSSSSWIPTQQVQSLPDVRNSSYSQTQKRYMWSSSASAPVPFSPPTGALDRPHPSSSYSHMESRTSADMDAHNGVIRNQRPHYSVRNRALSMIERPVSLDLLARGVGGRRGNANGSPKRKPLPKIYGCESCGKKFDRPSTLKVHEAIHTGAKDHECEYCLRAFTVQSNMKRHMRVCKHKPLSPPFTLYEFFYTTPSPGGQSYLHGSPSAPISGPASAFRSSTTSAPFRAPSVTFAGFAVVSSHPPMDIGQIDRCNSLPLNFRDVNQVPMIHTLSGNAAPMIPYELQLATQHQQSPQITQKFRGYKAPMIIAAMFSVNQKVPGSLAKLTLVRSDCAIPLSPVKPAEKYLVWYNVRGTVFPVDTAATTKDQDQVNADMYLNFDADVDPPANASTSTTTKPNDRPSIPSDPSTPPAGPLSPPKPGGSIGEPDKNPSTSSGSQVAVIDRSMRTKNLLPLPLDRLEERNSYLSRTRHCYHPAEYDAIAILPGPGIKELPIDHEEENNAGGSL